MPAPTAGAPAPPPPDRFDEVLDVWNPGGDPAALRRAAATWRETAAILRASADDLHTAVTGVGTWQGTARQRFADHWQRLSGSVHEGAGRLDEIAASIDAVADQIEQTNAQVHQLYLALGITVAVGVASSVVSLGLGSAAAAGAAATQAAQAAALVAHLGRFLTLTVRTMSGFRAALAAFGQRWAIAAAGNVVAGGIQRLAFGANRNPFAGWGVSDATKVVLGATTTAGFTTAAANSARLAPYAARRPLGSAFVTGFAGNGASSVAADLWVDHRPLSLATVRNAAVSGVAGGGGGTATQLVLGRLAVNPSSPGSPYVPRALPGALASAPRLVSVPWSGLWAPGVTPLRHQAGLWVPRAGTVARRGGLWVPSPAPALPSPRLWVPKAHSSEPTGTLAIEALVGIPVDAAAQAVAAPLLSAPRRPPPPRQPPWAAPWPGETRPSWSW